MMRTVLVKSVLWYTNGGIGFERIFFEYLFGIFVARAFIAGTFRNTPRWVPTVLICLTIMVFVVSIYITANEPGYKGGISGYDGDIYFVLLLGLYMVFVSIGDPIKTVLSCRLLQFIGKI